MAEIKKVPADASTSTRTLCAANHTMKTLVLYHNRNNCARGRFE